MPKFYNKTRQSSSIPRKLLREGKWYLLPLYYVLRSSELAREGIEHSGSYRFADHIYANKPKGKFLIGKALDAILLNLKSSQSLRARYIHAKEEIHNLLTSVRHEDPIDILTMPCGLAREFFEVADELKQNVHPHYNRIRWHGIDLDDELVHFLNEKSKQHGHEMKFMVGDALRRESRHPEVNYDMVISTGFTEFLSDEDTLRLYSDIRDTLKDNGFFFTSGMTPHALSEYLMRNIAELRAYYRSEDELKVLAREAGFKKIHTYRNQLQTILIGSN